MNTVTTINLWLEGFFACAALHYAVYWWQSRREWVLLLFAVQCATYAVFCVLFASYYSSTTIAEAQPRLERFFTLGVLVHALTIHLYAGLGARRDRGFRALVTGSIIFLALLNLWLPMRGTILELQVVQLPGGGTALFATRTPPGVLIALYYLVLLAEYSYGCWVAAGIWKRDRAGAVLIGVASVVILAGIMLAVLIDFAHVRGPYAGALPHAIFVVCVALFFSREYAARGRRVAAAKRQFEAAFEHGPIGKAMLAPDGYFLQVNRALSRILGWNEEELCARRLCDVMEQDQGPPEPQLQRLLELPAYIVEKRFLQKDGEAVWGLLGVSAVPDDEGRPVQIIAQMQDVTELRAHRERLEELVATRTRELSEAKDEAERANRAKSQFLAHMSHEIRNPLHAMLAYAQSLERDRSLGEAQRTKVGIVRSSGKHLQTILDDVLEMAKIEAGRPKLAAAAFDPWEPLVEVEQMFAGEAAAKGIELSVERASELPRALLGDGPKVTQILINLTSNSLKFTQRGAIRLVASANALANGSMLVKVVVADTGIGITAQDAARMFQPFEQLDAGKRAGGTGLGLAISLAYARLMGGDLSVESTPGTGSKFTLSYVAQRIALEAPPEAAEVSALSARPETRYKVLIVDDTALNRDILSETLAGPEFEIRTAADGESAVSIDTEWCSDLVLMDLRMPGMGGLEAIRRMRAVGSGAAIGVVTASMLDDNEREALALGADFFIRKPYDYGDLLDKIASVLEASKRKSAPPLPIVASAQDLTGGRAG